MIDTRGNLVYDTALIFNRADGEVVDRGEYLRIRTPGNPTFWWGNYLLFGQPPAPGDVARWEAIFEREIVAEQPQSQHRAFGWLGERGEADAFLEAGYAVSEAVALACTQPILPPHTHAGITVRPIEGDAEWQAATDLQVLTRDAAHGEADYRAFKTAQMARYRLLADAGRGHWYGAWIDGRLVGNLGLFAGEGVARYQNVGTHPDFRRLGIAARLVYEAACHMLATFGERTLVIVAEDDGPQRIYRSVGFAPAGVAYGVDKAPPAAPDA